MTPENVKNLLKKGFSEVRIEAGAGESAKFNDPDYRAAGAEIVGTAREVYGNTDIVLKVRPPNFDIEVPMIRQGSFHRKFSADFSTLTPAGSTMISFVWPAQNKPLVQKLAEKNLTLFAMDAIPRITRAQGTHAALFVLPLDAFLTLAASVL